MTVVYVFILELQSKVLIFYTLKILAMHYTIVIQKYYCFETEETAFLHLSIISFVVENL